LKNSQQHLDDCYAELLVGGATTDEAYRAALAGADLLGHTIQSVTGTYARSTPEALEDAVNRLAEPRGNVIKFKRKAS
jgi:hypothetical protein